MSGIGPHPYQVSGLSVSSLISCSGARMGLAGEAAKPAESEGDEQQRSALICMRLGSARPSNPRQLMLAKEGNHSSAPRTQRTFRLVSSEDELHLHGLLGMVVNQIERSLSLFRIKGLRDHGLRLQCAALEPLNDFREEMSVEPGPDKGQLLLDDLLLTDIAGCRREAEETNAAGRACDPASLLQKRSTPAPSITTEGPSPSISPLATSTTGTL